MRRRMLASVVTLNQEEEMYKELFLGIADGSYAGRLVFPDGFNTTRNFFIASCPYVTEVEYQTTDPNFNVADQFIYSGNTSLTRVIFPNLTAITGRRYAFSYGYWVNPIHIHIPKVKRIVNFNQYGILYAKNLRYFHIDLPCAEIMEMSGFPWIFMGYEKYAAFVGSDGSLDYNQTTAEWDFTPIVSDAASNAPSQLGGGV